MNMLGEVVLAFLDLPAIFAQASNSRLSESSRNLGEFFATLAQVSARVVAQVTNFYFE